MNEKVKDFLKKINSDEVLKKEFIALNEQVKNAENQDKVMAEYILTFAKKHGFNINATDFEAAEGEMSEEELIAVSGGGGCGCAIGGGGSGVKEKDGKDYVCACVGAGFGEGDDPADMCCICPFVGGGADGGL